MTEGFHPYTRKEIANWVESHTRFKYQDLKNGVFFCKMLALKFPEESAGLKYNANPISEYDCTNNLNLMKKALNKRGFQLNLNIQTVLNSKNNFLLAKWFKGLFEDVEPANVSNYSSVPRESTSTFRDLPNKKVQETPKKPIEEKEQKIKKKIESAEKSSKNSLSKVKRLSMAKSEAMFLKEKRSMRTQLKIPIHKQKKSEQSNQRFYETQIIPKSNEISDNDDINQVLYERALQESIQSLSKILQRVKSAITASDPQSYSQYKKQISRSIFTR